MKYIYINIYLKILLFVRITFCSSVVKTLFQMTYRIYPAENIYLQNQIYQMDIDKENFVENSIDNLNVEILREIKIQNQQSIELNGDERLFSFNLGDNIDVMLLRNKSIECLYQIKNYLQDDEIIIERKECQLYLSHSYCYQLHQLNEQIYIVQCKYNENNTLIQIINQSQIFDEIIIPIQTFCKSDSIFYNQTLIIFNKQCQTTKFYSIEIINLSFQNIQHYDLIDKKKLGENRAQLIGIQFSAQGNLYITYTNQILQYFLKTQEIYIFYQHPGFEILKFQSFTNQTTNLLTQVNTETKQVYLNEFNLNFSSQDIQNVFFITKNINLFHFTDRLFAKVSSLTSNIISIYANNLIQIGKLPYFMAITNQQLKLIKLYLPKSVITYNNSDQILIKQVGLRYCPFFLINLKLQDPNNPIQHFHQTNMLHEILNPNEQVCISYQIYKRTLPIKINQIMENGKVLTIFENQNAQFMSYLDRILYFGKVLFLHKLTEDQILIGLNKEDKLIKLIFYQNGKTLKTHNFKLLDNLINIYFLREYMYLTIIYQKSIEIYKLRLEQIEKTIQNTNVKIIQAIQSKQYLYYLLEDCTKMKINFFSNKVISGKPLQKLDCKSSLQTFQDDIYFDSHSIHFNQQSQFNQIITLKETISEIRNVLSDYLLLFTCLDNQYSIKLYLVSKTELIFLYTLPTYNYMIQFPFKYKIQNSILMIKAQSSSQGFFILIYDLQQTAVESLIQITEIDREERLSFDFLNDKEFIYQYQGQLQFKKLDSPCFSLNISHESHDFVQDKAIIIKSQSLISNQSIDLDFHLISINKNYKLQILKQNQSILTDNIISFKNIFGNIEDLQIVGSEYNQVYQSLIFTNNSIMCVVYRLGLCINETSIQRNIFDLNTSTLTYTENMVFDIFYIGFNPDDCNHAIFLKEKDSIKVNEFNFCYNNSKLKKDFTIITDSDQHFLDIKDIIQINDLQIIRQSNDHLSFFFQYYTLQETELTKSFSNQAFPLFDAVKINNFTYLFINIQYESFELSIINITKVTDSALYDKILRNKYNWTDLLANLSSSFSQIKFTKIQIYQVDTTNGKSQIKFIIILESYLAFLIKLTIDLNNLDNIQLEQSGIIRYEQDTIFYRSLFMDDNYMILAFKNDQNNFINVFDISNLSEHKNIDSIQKLTDNNYTAIERYNETHFVMVENTQSQYMLIHLITLDKVRVVCKGQCSKPAQLKISNQVSEIVIELQFKNEKEIKISQQFIIIISTLICILIKLYKKQAKISIRKKEQT